MATNPFHAFIELISFDKSLFELERSLEQKQADINKLNTSIKDLDLQLESSKQAHDTARKFVDEQELVMKELNQSESEDKKKLDGVKNQKEYRAITAELEAIHAKQQDQEVALLGAWNTVEQAEKAYNQKKEEVATQRSELEKQLKEQSDEVEAARKELAGKQQEREGKTVGVNPEWLEKYKAMRARVDNPVVPVQGGMCSACFLSIPSQTMADLRHNKLLQCKQCFRFLYLEEAEASVPNKED